MKTTKSIAARRSTKSTATKGKALKVRRVKDAALAPPLADGIKFATDDCPADIDAEARRLFPDLPYVIRTADGKEATGTVMDLRQEMFRLRRMKGDTLSAEPSATAFSVPAHPRFVVVRIALDGSEQLAKFGVTAVEAVKYVGGFNASQATTGSYAEAREIDMATVRTTGRLLNSGDVLSQAAKFPQNQGKAVKHGE